MSKLTRYTKAIVSIAGGTVTATIAVIPPHTTTWSVLAVVSATLTAIGVFAFPNTPPPK